MSAGNDNNVNQLPQRLYTPQQLEEIANIEHNRARADMNLAESIPLQVSAQEHKDRLIATAQAAAAKMGDQIDPNGFHDLYQN